MTFLFSPFLGKPLVIFIISKTVDKINVIIDKDDFFKGCKNENK
jgi:hypothetical protein